MPILKHIDFEVPGFGELAAPPIAVPSYRDAVMALSPLAYWRMGESTGTTLADETGNHPLQLDGAHAMGQAGAIQRDDDDGILMNGGNATAAGAVLPSLADAPFSMAFWIRLPAGPVQNGAFAGQYTGTTNNELRVHFTTAGELRLSMLPGFDLTTPPAIDTTWRHAVVTRSVSGVASWYIDGQLVASLSGAGLAIPQAPFVLGQVAASIPVFYLDEFAILDVALSPEQVRWLHGLGRATLALPIEL